MERFFRQPLTNPEDELESVGIEYRLFRGSDSAPEDSEASERVVIRKEKVPSRAWPVRRIFFGVAVAGLLASAVYRVVALGQSPWTPIMIVLFLVGLRRWQARRRWNRVKADLIAGGMSPDFFKKR